MTKKFIIVSCIALSFISLFMFFGYAKLTDTLNIGGTFEADTPKGLFIIGIEQKGNASRLDVYKASFQEYSTTVQCDLSKTSSGTAGSVTYTITVINNTNYEYAYRDLYYQTSTSGYNNNYISKTNGNNNIGVVTSFPNGKVVRPGATLEFQVTYTLGSNRTNFAANKTLKTLINYQFGINIETEEAAREAVNEKFMNILNTTTTYEELVDVLDNKFDGRQEWTSNYVGNVGNATTDDAMAVNTLFAGQLQMIINGKVQPASVLIKHENLDGNNMTGDDYVARNSSNGGVFYGYGCEMTLYLTTESLDTPNTDVKVYVCVFTCNRDEQGNIIGDWYRIGDSYAGYANVVGYNGEAGGTGSFVTDNWVSARESYSPAEGYTYTVGDGLTLDELTQTYDPSTIQAFQELLTDAKAMIDDINYAGTGITIVEEAYSRARAYYTIDANGNPVANQDTLRVWLCPHMREISNALTRAQDEIDKIMGGG